MITHKETYELLAAFALDAVGTDARRQIGDHLARCPRCRFEVDAFRDVAAAMGNSVEALPPDLWRSIANRLPERADASRPPMPRLRQIQALPESAAQQHPFRSGFRARRLATIGSVVGVAATVTGVLGIGLVRADDRVNRLQSQPPSTSGAVVTALETRGHQIINMTDGNDLRKAQFILANGRGYLVSSNLPSLKRSQTYQLWGDIGNQPISLGLLGQSLSQSTFTLAGTSEPSRLRITVEPAGGSVVPSSAVVAAGSV
jgi:anti-sigma-K factor RskA